MSMSILTHVQRCELAINVGLADEFLEGAGGFVFQTLKFRFEAGLYEVGKDGAVGLDDFGSRARFQRFNEDGDIIVIV